MNDFKMIVNSFLDKDEIKIYPLSDLHIGSAGFNQKKWDDFKKLILSDPNAYITIGGDIFNNSIKTSISNIYEETMRPAEQKKWVARELESIRDRILCVVSGNHEKRSMKEVDDDPIYDVCCKLDIEDLYRENAAFLKIQIGKKADNKPATYTICVIHGTGGGVLSGAVINRNERFGYIIDGLDVLITGHSHKGIISRPRKIFIDPRNNMVSFKDFTVITSTAWCDYGGYTLNKMLLPASLDLQYITLSGKEKKVQVTF